MIRRLARPISVGAILVATDTAVGLTVQPWWLGVLVGAAAGAALFVALLHDTPRDTPR